MRRTFRSLADADFNRLFQEFQHTAYRLEALQKYDVSYEEDEFGRFLAGRSRGSFPGISEWIDGTVVKAVGLGKRIHRVHVVELPMSDYVRFECAWAYPHTVAAGEDVRILPVRNGEWPDLPHQDYWLFDSSLLVVMNYESDGTFSSAETVDDANRIVQANYWRDVAVGLSVSYVDFASGYDDRFQTAGE